MKNEYIIKTFNSKHINPLEKDMSEWLNEKNDEGYKLEKMLYLENMEKILVVMKLNIIKYTYWYGTNGSYTIGEPNDEES